MSDAICKGAWALGSACGKCSRCRETALEAAIRFQEDARRPQLPVSPSAGYGLVVDGELQNVAFVEEFDATEHVKRIWKSGVLIEIVPVRVIRVTDVAFGAGLK